MSIPNASRAPRSIALYATLASITIACGLGSRRYPEHLPAFVATYAGDTLWAALMFWLVCLLRRRASTLSVAIVAVSISFVVEVSQLYHAPWIDAIRHHRLGALVLGEGFLWSDLACYVVGVSIAAIVDVMLTARR